jgi:hypothetical protein
MTIYLVHKGPQYASEIIFVTSTWNTAANRVKAAHPHVSTEELNLYIEQISGVPVSPLIT